jgi:hypothetical protein
VKVRWSEAAAKTVIDPVGPVLPVAVPLAEVPVALLPVAPPEAGRAVHAARLVPTTTTSAIAAEVRRSVFTGRS